MTSSSPSLTLRDPAKMREAIQRASMLAREAATLLLPYRPLWLANERRSLDGPELTEERLAGHLRAFCDRQVEASAYAELARDDQEELDALNRAVLAEPDDVPREAWPI